MKSSLNVLSGQVWNHIVLVTRVCRCNVYSTETGRTRSDLQFRNQELGIKSLKYHATAISYEFIFSTAAVISIFSRIAISKLSYDAIIKRLHISWCSDNNIHQPFVKPAIQSTVIA